jgi:hypothetical protein
MNWSTSRLRGRAFVSAWFTVLVAVLAIVALAGAGAAYTAHVDPGTTTEQAEQTHWTADGTFQHAATVTRENPVFEQGTTLTNRSTYFVQATPVLDGTFVATYGGPASDPAAVDVDVSLLVRASGEETVYWTNRTVLGSASEEAVDPGGTVTVPFSLNATEVAQHRDAVQSALGETPGEVSTLVAADVRVNGSVDGETTTLTFTQELPLTVEGDSYTVGPESGEGGSMTTTQMETVPREYGSLWAYGGPSLLLLGAVGLSGLGFGRRRNAFALSTEERDLLAFRDERAEFDEWIVRARFAETFDREPNARAESLSDLVDFAIDAGTSVVEDPQSGAFYAVSEQLLVTYEPPRLARAAIRDEENNASDPDPSTEGVTLNGDEEMEDAPSRNADTNGSAESDAETSRENGDGEGRQDDDRVETGPSEE